MRWVMQSQSKDQRNELRSPRAGKTDILAQTEGEFARPAPFCSMQALNQLDESPLLL